MKITISSQSAKPARSHKAQERFDKLSAKLKKQRQLNQRFRQDLDELVEFHRQHSRERDLAQLEGYKALADKLLVFASRKSLPEWQKKELAEWIVELADKIRPFEPDRHRNPTQPLHRLSQILGRVTGRNKRIPAENAARRA
ncbi:MAG: hypothetical protein HQL47_03445 [Gammaproteobacteria bacterium]|nr:hypothetical protein [Gammaproteobacteria bacterium]